MMGQEILFDRNSVFWLIFIINQGIVKKVTFSNISIASSTSASILSWSYSTCTQFSAISLLPACVNETSMTGDPFTPWFSWETLTHDYFVFIESFQLNDIYCHNHIFKDSSCLLEQINAQYNYWYHIYQYTCMTPDFLQQSFIPSTMAYLPFSYSQTCFIIIIASSKWGFPPKSIPLHPLFFFFISEYAPSYPPSISKIYKRFSRRVTL